MKRKGTFWATVGMILVMTSIIGTLYIGTSGAGIIPLVIMGIMALAGVLIIAWVYSD